ncbi:MAG TPA: polyprenyl synthetase family protein [Candidatus Pelethomonas intestinigallinarum]|nr:polyprenyl synthetase family protein [Candidatus Pelethomonas intestinigallinarum]
MCAFQLRYDSYRAAVDDHLGGLFADAKDKPYRRLQEAMRYSLLAGGKRVRPVMTLAFCDMLGGQWREALPFACALELVHTYSLIHDDLPCMDDDDLRRGRPTCHKVYGETMAVLAGDALQGEAFGLIAAAPAMTAQQRIDAVAVLSAACGGGGMVAGQVLDVDHLAQGETDLRLLHRLKTGAMLQAAAELGCVAAGADDGLRQRARDYGCHIGLAFQVRDDVLDVVADQGELGKPIGSDRAEGKRTFVDLLGLEACQALVAEETAKAKAALADLPDSGFLLNLADHLAERRK